MLNQNIHYKFAHHNNSSIIFKSELNKFDKQERKEVWNK